MLIIALSPLGDGLLFCQSNPAIAKCVFLPLGDGLRPPWHVACI